jgi:hypothetical protein
MKLLARTKCLAVVCGVVGWLGGALPVLAQMPAPVLEFASDPNTVIVEYTHIHHMLAEPDPTPLLRIYGDGRVRVHYPVYMAKAGDYELWLSAGELRGIVLGLAADGIMDFDPVAAKDEWRGAKEAERGRGEAYHVSDVTETAIEVRLQFYRPAGATALIPNLQKRVRWPNVHTDARRYPDLAPVRAVAAAEARLQALLKRRDLVRIQ